MKTSRLVFDENKLKEIGQKYKLVFVVLFGSKARGERVNPETDLDIAVLTKKETSYKLYRNIYGDIANLFLGQNTDARFLNDADLLFCFNVVRDGVLLYGNEEDYMEYKLAIARRYVDDGKKYFPARDQFLLKRQRELEKYL